MILFARPRRILLTASAFGLAMTSGVANAETLSIQTLSPASNSRAASVASIMVERFDGPDGRELSFAIERELRGATIDGQPYFQMETDPTRSEAVLSGTARVGIDEFEEFQPRTECVEYGANDQCVKSKETKITCSKKLVSLNSSIRLTDTIDGGIIYSSNKGDQKQIVFCPDVKNTESTEDLVTSMISDAASSVRHDMAPRQYSYSVSLQETRKGLPRTYKNAFKAAVDLSEADQNASCAAFNDLYIKAPEARSVIYNAAICAERAGDFDKAINLFTKGIGRYSLSNSPTTSRDRVKRMRKNYLAAKAQISVR